MTEHAKQVYLATCYFQQNYGSALQAYATQVALDRLGILNSTINIGGIKRIIDSRKKQYFATKLLDRDIVRDKLSYISLAARRVVDMTMRSATAKRQDTFARFVNSSFRLTDLTASFELLADDVIRRASTVVVGSDQLWLPSNIAARYYTLEWVPDSVKRVSYATSFGVATLPTPQARHAQTFLRRFADISVREEGGRSLVKDLVGRNATLVVDPVLLMSAAEWNTLVPQGPTHSSGKIFCYLLGNRNNNYSFVEKMAEHTDLRVTGFIDLDSHSPRARSVVEQPIHDADPLDFVALIRDAEYVCTDSFHATVLSLLFHKKFFTLKRFSNGTTASTNGRLDSLFNTLGGGLTFSNPETNAVDAARAHVDWSIIDTSIDALREASVNYIKGAL
jgi:hypothetical protein